MEWIIILIAVISIISSANKKKKRKQQEEAQRRAAQEASQMEGAQPVRPMQQPTRSARFPDEFGQQPTAHPQSVRQQQVTMADLPVRANPTQAEIERRRQAIQAQMAKRTGLEHQRQGAAPTLHSSIPHVVKPLTESPHAHTESSMGGGETCPPPMTRVAPEAVKPAAMSEPEQKRQASPSMIPALGFSQKELVRGILYSEILGKPKALRKARR